MSESQNAKFKPGKVLDDKWIIIELIGKGAMGEVYRAHQTNLKRDVAIKIISEDVMSELEEDPDELEIAFGRFQREVQTMAQVRHANILTIYDYGEIEEVEGSKESRIAYIIMEYIPGNSMRFTLSEDGLDDVPELYGEWIRKYFMPILEGVEILHSNKIIHRDLKPENIFMDGDIPKIADFGLARSYQMKAVTSSLEMLGTLAYMSPEQCSDFKNADYPTDIYALGKILFESVNGTLTQKIVPFTSVGIDNPQDEFLIEMNVIIGKATAEKPNDRYQTVQELRSDLQKALSVLDEESNGEPIRSEIGSSASKLTDRQIKWLSVGVVIAIISVTAMSVYHYFGTTEPQVRLDEKTHLDNNAPPSGQHIVTVENKNELKRTIIGRDGGQLILTGVVQGTTAEQLLFYMDKRKISNFLFLEYLNDFKLKLSVENGIVRHDNKIIIYIGDGSNSEDKIFFEHSTFHLKNQDDGIKPVLRVTYHGALMYANEYGKELLSEKEWRFGYRYHLQNVALEDSALQQPEGQTSHNMMHGTSVEEKENKPKVLDDMGQVIKEWVSTAKASGKDKAESPGGDSASGVMDATRVDEKRKALLRYPWEGFDDVGFRTKIPIVGKKDSP
jgi:serine/threonine protein kinase